MLRMSSIVRIVRRQGWGILLDIVFAGWALTFMATGEVLPGPIADLLRADQPVAAEVVPNQVPNLPSDIINHSTEPTDPS
jgi:hypothetical protein